MKIMAAKEAESIQQCVTNDKLNSSRFNPFSNFSLFSVSFVLVTAISCRLPPLSAASADA